MRSLCLLCGVLAVVSAEAAATESLADDAATSSFPGEFSASARAGIWSTDRTLDNKAPVGTGSAWLTAKFDPNEDTSFHFEGWVGARRSNAPEGDLREAQFSQKEGNIRFSIGRSVIVWGRADKINPTDNLGARDYTLLFSDDDDQRLGIFNARADIDLGDLTLTALWIPEFRPTIFPIPPLPNGIDFGPSKTGTTTDQFALRLDQSGGDVDWSLSWFDGPNRIPTIDVAALTAAGAVLERRYDRTDVLGGDFATSLGPWGFRGEAAWTFVRDTKNTPDALRSSFFAVVGTDRTLGNWTINLQGLLHQTADPLDGLSGLTLLETVVAKRSALIQNQLRQTQIGASERISYLGLHDTLEAELEGVAYFTDGSGALRPKFTYAISDHLKAIIGADFYFGSFESFFGQLKANKLVFAELRYGF